MKRIASCFSLRHALLAVPLIIVLYLLVITIGEAPAYSKQATYFNEPGALISWTPSTGSVSHYLLEITDTRFINSDENSLTRIYSVRSDVPRYRLSCEHNHSYQVRVKAVSPQGLSSDYSEASILFICDQEKPEIILPYRSSPLRVNTRRITIEGSIRETHLSSITVNGTPVAFNPAIEHFATSIALRRGANLIDVTARDLAGNTSTERMEITGRSSLSRLDFPGKAAHSFELDYNGDGKRDLLIGTAEGTIALCINRGTDADPLFTGYRLLRADGKDIDVGTHAAPFMTDYDDDGRPDLLVGNGEGLLFYYGNLGSRNHPVFGQASILEDIQGETVAVDDYCTPCVVDWDDNGTKDILLGSGSGKIVLYRNEGIDSDPLFSLPEPILVEGEAVVVEGQALPLIDDVNGDGTKDLLVKNERGSIYLFLNSVLGGEPDLIKADPGNIEEIKIFMANSI